VAGDQILPDGLLVDLFLDSEGDPLKKKEKRKGVRKGKGGETEKGRREEGL
jgi:hypothetical protein